MRDPRPCWRVGAVEICLYRPRGGRGAGSVACSTPRLSLPGLFRWGLDLQDVGLGDEPNSGASAVQRLISQPLFLENVEFTCSPFQVPVTVAFSGPPKIWVHIM